MSDLDRIFDNHKNTVIAILKDAKSLDDCRLEIKVALDRLDSELQDHDCNEECGHELSDFDLADGEYLIVAKNLNEVDRIEKFIEELETNPYTP